MSWHDMAYRNNRWQSDYTPWKAVEPSRGYQIVEHVDGPGGDWVGETAAILVTDDGKFWAAHQPGGCSCVSGEGFDDLEGPYETYADALRMIPDSCSELFERRS